MGVSVRSKPGGWISPPDTHPRGHPGDLTLRGGPAPGTLRVPQDLLQRHVDGPFPILRGGDTAATAAGATMG